MWYRNPAPFHEAQKIKVSIVDRHGDAEVTMLSNVYAICKGPAFVSLGIPVHTGYADLGSQSQWAEAEAGLWCEDPVEDAYFSISQKK